MLQAQVSERFAQLSKPIAGRATQAVWRRKVFVAIRCQAVESVNYRVHRLATVATQLAKWRCPASARTVYAPSSHYLLRISILRGCDFADLGSFTTNTPCS